MALTSHEQAERRAWFLLKQLVQISDLARIPLGGRQENCDVDPASARLIATRLLSLLHGGCHVCGHRWLA
jgi:hypothetical protein